MKAVSDPPAEPAPPPLDPLDPRSPLGWPFPDRRPPWALRMLIEYLFVPTIPAFLGMYLFVLFATNSLDLSFLSAPRTTQGLAAIALLVALGSVPYLLLRRPIDWTRHDLLLHTEAAAALRDVRRWQRRQGAKESEPTRARVESARSRLQQALRDRSPSRVHDCLNSLDAALGAPVPIGKRRALHEYLRTVGCAVLVALLCRAFLIDAYEVPSGAMLPLLQHGDHVLVIKIRYGFRLPWTQRKLLAQRWLPRRGDVVVFPDPQQPLSPAVGRVFALPGDRLQLCGGETRINGRPLPREPLSGRCEYEDYGASLPRGALHHTACTAYTERHAERSYVTLYQEGGGRPEGACGAERTVPPAHVYVQGDNRGEGYFAGSVPVDSLEGKAWILFWSAGEKTRIRTDRMFLSVDR